MKNKLPLSLVVIFALGAAGFLYLRKHPAPAAQDAPAAPASGPAASSGRTGFVGDSGYLMELPQGYEVYAIMRDKSELVFFYPKGTKPTSDEAQYKALGIVRLEVRAIPMVKGSRVSLEDLRNGVAYTLKQNKEAFTLKKVDLGRAAFQVDITAPNRIAQLFVQGGSAFYVFTAGDEKLMQALARTIRETAPAASRKAP